MSVAKHKDGFFVVIVKEEDGKALCKYSVSGAAMEEWFNIEDLIVQPPKASVKINIISVKRDDEKLSSNKTFHNENIVSAVTVCKFKNGDEIIKKDFAS